MSTHLVWHYRTEHPESFIRLINDPVVRTVEVPRPDFVTVTTIEDYTHPPTADAELYRVSVITVKGTVTTSYNLHDPVILRSDHYEGIPYWWDYPDINPSEPFRYVQQGTLIASLVEPGDRISRVHLFDWVSPIYVHTNVVRKLAGKLLLDSRQPLGVSSLLNPLEPDAPVPLWRDHSDRMRAEAAITVPGGTRVRVLSPEPNPVIQFNGAIWTTDPLYIKAEPRRPHTRYSILTEDTLV